MDWDYVAKVLPLYGKAAVLTVRLGVLGILFSLLVGLLCALMPTPKTLWKTEMRSPGQMIIPK